MTQNEGQNFGSSSRALGAFDQRGPYGILIHLGVDFVKMNESQFRAENPAAKYPLPYRQQLLSNTIDLIQSSLSNISTCIAYSHMNLRNLTLDFLQD